MCVPGRGVAPIAGALNETDDPATWSMAMNVRAGAALVLLVTSAIVGSCAAPLDSDHPVPPLSLSIVSGDNQSAPPGTQLPNPLVARVDDGRGHRVSGQIVNFRVVDGGGSVFAGAAITNRDGLAQELWTLGQSGPQRVEARAVDPATGAPLTFAVFNATVTDIVGPLTASLAATPNPAGPTDVVLVTATVSDQTAGNSVIAGAEVSVDGAAFTPMAAQDGAFDQATEAVRQSSGPLTSFGDHQVCVRGRDAASNTGAPVCLTAIVAQPVIYVSTAGDDANPGTPAAPVRKIEVGISRAVAAGIGRVNVSGGTFIEMVGLVSGVSIYGGYNPTD